MRAEKLAYEAAANPARLNLEAAELTSNGRDKATRPAHRGEYWRCEVRNIAYYHRLHNLIADEIRLPSVFHSEPPERLEEVIRPHREPLQGRDCDQRPQVASVYGVGVRNLDLQSIASLRHR